MLVAVVCATWCGFREIRPVVQWLDLHGVGMWHLLGFLRKPPVRQTYANLLAKIDPDVLEAVLLEFVEQLKLPEKIPVETSSAKADITHSLAKELSSTATPPDTNESKIAYDLVRRLVLTRPAELLIAVFLRHIESPER